MQFPRTSYIISNPLGSANAKPLFKPFFPLLATPSTLFTNAINSQFSSSKSRRVSRIFFPLSEEKLHQL